jgi:hypothetical protein
MATTSGTYAFNPSIASVSLYALNKCGIRPTAILQEHMESARMAANFVLADWGNRGVNLWQVQSFTAPLVQGTASYSVSPTLVNILDLFVTTTNGSYSTNRYLLPISRTEYASYPNPTQQGAVTVYWHERTFTPTVNFYPTPDGTSTSFTYWALVQMQDAGLANGQVADVPYLWLDAFQKAMAAELADTWAPDREPGLSAKAEISWGRAASTGVETSNIYIAPQLSGYWQS